MLTWLHRQSASKRIDFPSYEMLNYPTMSLITNLSVQQLRQAADLKEKIEGLEKQLSQVFGSSAHPAAAAKADAAKAPKKKGGMSAAGKARIAAAQKARWAKIKAAKK
jgi:hypothetical protein